MAQALREESSETFKTDSVVILGRFSPASVRKVNVELHKRTSRQLQVSQLSSLILFMFIDKVLSDIALQTQCSYAYSVNIEDPSRIRMESIHHVARQYICIKSTRERTWKCEDDMYRSAFVDDQNECALCGGEGCSECTGEGFREQERLEKILASQLSVQVGDLEAAISRVKRTFARNAVRAIGGTSSCWICLEAGTEDSPLYHAGCACRGSAGFGHESCFATAARADSRRINCDICKQPTIGFVQLVVLDAMRRQGVDGARGKLAVVLAIAGQHCAALRLAHQEYETMQSRNNLRVLAQVLSYAPEHRDQSIRVYRRLLASNAEQASTEDEDREEMMADVSRLASVLLLTEPSEAAALLRDNIRYRIASGNSQASVLHDKTMLSEALILTGEVEEARSIFLRMEADVIALLGPRHPFAGYINEKLRLIGRTATAA